MRLFTYSKTTAYTGYPPQTTSSLWYCPYQPLEPFVLIQYVRRNGQNVGEGDQRRDCNRCSKSPGQPQPASLQSWSASRKIRKRIKSFAGWNGTSKDQAKQRISCKIFPLLHCYRCVISRSWHSVRTEVIPLVAILPKSYTCFRRLTLPGNYHSYSQMRNNLDFYLRDW